jgi:hypothetical protein
MTKYRLLQSVAKVLPPPPTKDASRRRALEALAQVNDLNCTTCNDDERCGMDAPSAGEVHADGRVWMFPCQAVFPVNIGGLLAWIVQFQRGSARLSPPLLQAHGVRVERLAEQGINVAWHRKSPLSKGVQS